MLYCFGMRVVVCSVVVLWIVSGGCVADASRSVKLFGGGPAGNHSVKNSAVAAPGNAVMGFWEDVDGRGFNPVDALVVRLSPRTALVVSDALVGVSGRFLDVSDEEPRPDVGECLFSHWEQERRVSRKVLGARGRMTTGVDWKCFPELQSAHPFAFGGRSVRARLGSADAVHVEDACDTAQVRSSFEVFHSYDDRTVDRLEKLQGAAVRRAQLRLQWVFFEHGAGESASMDGLEHCGLDHVSVVRTGSYRGPGFVQGLLWNRNAQSLPLWTQWLDVSEVELPKGYSQRLWERGHTDAEGELMDTSLPPGLLFNERGEAAALAQMVVRGDGGTLAVDRHLREAPEDPERVVPHPLELWHSELGAAVGCDDPDVLSETVQGLKESYPSVETVPKHVAWRVCVTQRLHPVQSGDYVWRWVNR